MSTAPTPASIRATATWRLPPDPRRTLSRLGAFALPLIPIGGLGWLIFDDLDLRLAWLCLALFIWWGIWIRIFLTGRSFPMVYDGEGITLYDPRGRLRWPLPPGSRAHVAATERPVRRSDHTVSTQVITLLGEGEDSLRLIRTVPAEDLADLPRIPWTTQPALEVWNGDEALFAALCRDLIVTDSEGSSKQA